MVVARRILAIHKIRLASRIPAICQIIDLDLKCSNSETPLCQFVSSHPSTSDPGILLSYSHLRSSLYLILLAILLICQCSHSCVP